MQTEHPDLRRGPWRPRRTTSPPVPGSARRTSSIDVVRPDGLLGRCAIDVRGRDVAVDADGQVRAVAEVRLSFDVDPTGRVRRVSGGPAAERLAPLVGANLRSGFGRLVAEVLDDELRDRALVGSLVEDVAAAFLVSGYAPLRAGLFPADPSTAEVRAGHMADVCIGWAAGGPLHRVLATAGRSAVPIGPPAPRLEGPDPAGWHDLPRLADGTVRRRRSLDLAPSPSGPGAVARAHFRDSHAGDDGETVMHEYGVVVEVAGDGDGRITGVDVDPLVLPWEACPGAVASAARIVGMSLADLPRRARTELAGASTCTHLTSTLRSLADARALADLAGLTGVTEAS